MSRTLKRAGKLLLALLPLVLGMLGLWVLAGEPVQDALFSCVGMYVLNYGDTPPNLLVELARWLAPLNTASWILMALQVARDHIHGLIRCLIGDGVAVYGPEVEQTQLLSRLGRSGIKGTNEVLPARQYILLGEGADSFALCRKIREGRPRADVFLRCADLRPQSVTSPRLHLFSPEETAARLFWKEECLYTRSKAQSHRLSIVVLGGGALAKNLLYYGLLDNIFHPEQAIEYHVFGDCAQFAAVHTQLDKMGRDSVTVHQEPWWESLELLRAAHLVLLLPQENQAAMAQDLLLAAPGPKMVAFTGDPALNLLAEAGGLEVFPWLELALRPEHILQDDLLAQAKRVNLHYAHLYGGVEETDENREAEWAKLNGFTRYSNISCADYHDIRLRMLRAMGCSPAADQLPGDVMELLAELEHIRWCRYHYLSNWQRGAGKDGQKDQAARLHPDLIPYGELTEADKKKDRDNIRELLKISH